MSVFVPPIFFRLPKAVVINFLSEWLDIRDVARLDAAMTTQSLHPTFLQCLQDMRSTTVNRQTICENGTGLRSSAFLVWLSSRRIYVEVMNLWKLGSASITENIELPFLRKLSVYGDVSESDILQLVKTSPALQSVTLYVYKRVHQVLHQIAGHCPLLEALRLHCSFLMDDFLYLLSKCSALKNITLNYAFEEWVGNDNWERLHPYGHLIQHIGIFRNAVNPPAFANFVDACQNLRSLDYFDIRETAEGEILLRAAQSCPLLENLHFDTHSPTAMRELSRKCKNLQHVYIRSSNQSLSSSDLAIFEQIETLESLSLEQHDLTNAHLAVICRFRNIKELEMQQCFFEDIVTEGMFVDTPISKTLEKIQIISRNLPVAALSCLMPCKKLREIDLFDCRCADASLAILATHFPLLDTITMGYDKERIDGLKSFITQHKHLIAVTLLNTVFGVNPNDEVAEAGFQSHLNDLRSCFPHIYFSDHLQ